MDFSQALNNIKQGRRVCREGWNGKGMFLLLIEGNETHVRFLEEYDFRSFIAIKDVQDKLTPWLASQADLLAEDWEVLN